MAISEFHASHIRRVYAAFGISSPTLEPSEVTRVTGITPTDTARVGGQRVTRWGAVSRPHTQGEWTVSSRNVVNSKDINDHLNHLLERLLPHREVLLAFTRDGEAFVSVLWESTYLYAGTGPLIDATCISGLASLGAGIGFDIYQIDEENEEESGA